VRFLKTIGIFDNTNYNFILNFLRKIYNINLVKDFKIYNAFSMKNIINEYDILLILADVNNINIEKIKHVITKSKILIINGEDEKLYKIIKESNLKDVYVLTYGFNSKSTLTVSSIDNLENKVVCFLQRSILNIDNELIEPKEIVVKKGNSNFSNKKLLGIIALMLKLGYLK